jgi:hypothetical protein
VNPGDLAPDVEVALDATDRRDIERLNRPDDAGDLHDGAIVLGPGGDAVIASASRNDIVLPEHAPPCSHRRFAITGPRAGARPPPNNADRRDLQTR